MSKSAAEAGSEIGQWLGQYNDNEQEQEVGDVGDEGIIQQTQASGPQNNTATQRVTAGGLVTSATSTAGAITNTEKVEAGGDALVSKSAAEAGSEIGQWLGQYNNNEQEQEVGDVGDEGIIQQTQASGPQNNTAEQTATSEPVATSTGGAITNDGGVSAGGDALVSKSRAEAASEIKQGAEQSNANEQDQEVGDVGDLGIIEQAQTSSSQSNTAEQTAEAAPDASSTAGAVTNTEEVEAGGDALVSKSAAEAGSEIGQWLGQYNDNEQEQEVGDAGDEGIIQQTQDSGPQNNTATQNAQANGADATSTAGAVTNTEEVEAGGDALVSKSAAEAGSEIGQWLDQSNGNEQEQEVGDVGDLGIIEQEQPSSSQSNTAGFQSANGSSDASSTAGAVTNTEEVEAGGDALVSKSAAEAGSEIGSGRPVQRQRARAGSW